MLYILLPIYNEQENLKHLIQTIFKECSLENVRIIAVNDGSSDSSLKVLQEELRPSDAINTHSINMNIGVVFSEGIRRFLLMGNENDVLIIMEADQTSNVSRLKFFEKGIQDDNKDIIIASRYHGSGCYQRFPISRKILSVGANRLLGTIFPIENVSDYTIFFRAYSWRILTKMQDYFGLHGMIQSKGFSANAEILIKASYLNASIAEIPFVYDYGKKKGESKIPIFRSLLEYFSMIMYLKKLSMKIRNKQLTKIGNPTK